MLAVRMSFSVQAMGDKTLARHLAEECGVPTVPGTSTATQDTADALDFVAKNGLPVILKAAMGGGGRGMRVVKTGGPHLEDCITLRE